MPAVTQSVDDKVTLRRKNPFEGSAGWPIDNRESAAKLREY